MIENMTNSEIGSLVEELEKNGYIGKQTKDCGKKILVDEEAEKIGMRGLRYSTELYLIYELADIVTNNVTYTKSRTRRNSYIPKEIEPKYREIVKGILEVIKPYYRPHSQPRWSVKSGD